MILYNMLYKIILYYISIIYHQLFPDWRWWLPCSRSPSSPPRPSSSPASAASSSRLSFATTGSEKEAKWRHRALVRLCLWWPSHPCQRQVTSELAALWKVGEDFRWHWESGWLLDLDGPVRLRWTNICLWSKWINLYGIYLKRRNNQKSLAALTHLRRKSPL